MAIRNITKHVALVVLTVFVSLVLLPIATFASVKGRKNTAIGLGAVSLYSLMKGRTGTGLLFGAGAAYAYKRYRDAAKHKHHRYSRTSYRRR